MARRSRARGGFAAAVVGDQIVIGGGENINGAFRLEPSVEIYTAGRNDWQFGPDMPIAVHGVAAGGLNGRFYVVSGSTAPGTAVGNTGKLHSILLGP